MIKPDVFKQVRKALGLTQQELADKIGLSRVTVNKMEQGRLKRGIPDEIAARLLALSKHPLDKVTLAAHARGENVVNTTRDAVCGPNVQTTSFDDHLWDNEEDDS